MPLYKQKSSAKAVSEKIRGRTSFPYIYCAFMDIVYTVPTKNARAKNKFKIFKIGVDK